MAKIEQQKAATHADALAPGVSPGERKVICTRVKEIRQVQETGGLRVEGELGTSLSPTENATDAKRPGNVAGAFCDV
jgi:hypothetical protein